MLIGDSVKKNRIRQLNKQKENPTRPSAGLFF
jgi:hypothetical protein